MHEMMFLEMCELRETLGADVTLEGPLAGMCSEVHLEVRQLTEGLAADVAFVVHLAILLLERVRQRSVSPRTLRIRAERAALGTTVIVRRQ